MPGEPGPIPNGQSLALSAGGGVTLRGLVSIPLCEPRGVVVCVHGFGEHHRRHDRLAQRLVDRSLAVVRYDLRGHGRSEGRRGDAPSYGQLLDDLELVWGHARERFRDTPTLLFGHSLGGGLVANWIIERQPSGLLGAVLSSPWFELKRPPSAWQRAIAGAVSSVVPTWTIPTGIRAENLTSDADSMREYRRDPLVVRRISLRMVLAALAAGERALERAALARVPLLVLHGSADRITCPEAAARFVAAAPAARMEIFRDLAHEMHFEARAADVQGVLVDWIETLLTSTGRQSRPG